MSEHHFFAGTGRGMVKDSELRQAETIARRHGASFIAVKLPGDGWRHWFACRSYGRPFDAATADAVRADLRAAGVVLP